ncbi:MAG: hypothetical protein II702_05050 [Clostridia bacterium]|nr:hypothetical protein [Clostridia bacterium]
MSYKYELHCHTASVSMCGKVEPERIVDLHREHGYNGIVLTDHYSELTFYKRHLFAPQKETEFFLAPYRRLLEYCEGTDFTVLLGVELRFYAHAADFLIYGIDEDFLYNCGNMMLWNGIKLLHKVHEAGGLVFQAHPFRGYILGRNHLVIDGVEVFNGKNSREANEKARVWAQKYGKLVSSGSDFHREEHIGKGGIITETPIKTNADLVSTLKNGSFQLIENY